MKINTSNPPFELEPKNFELLFKLIFNQQFQFMAILSPEGRVIDVNDFALTSQGVTREDYIGKYFWESPAWCNFPKWKKIWKTRLVKASEQTGAILTEDTFQVDDGSIRFADASTTAIYDPNNGQLVGFIVQAIDTTNRRTTENKIRKNEARLQFILKGNNIGDWELNLTDHTAYRSLKHDQIFGYDSLLVEWSYETFLEHVVPEDRACVDKKFQRAISNKTNWNFECRIRTKDGEIRWITASGGHLFDKTGIAEEMTGIVQDITQKKETELDNLRYSAELKSLFEALPDIYFRMKLDGTILDYQAQNKDEWYIKSKNLIGKRIQDIFSKKIGKLFQSKIEEMIQTEKTVEMKYELPINDEVIHFEARLNRLSINDQLVCVVRDVTQEFKSKEILAISEQRFRTIFEQAAIGVAMVNPKTGGFIRINQRFCDMLGYSEEEMLDEKTYRNITHPDDLNISYDYVNRVLEGRTEHSLKKRYLHRSGHTIWVELTVTPTNKTNSKTQPLIAVIQNISKRKEAEERLKLAANVFTHAGESIIITDATGTIIDVNDTFTATTGYSSEEAIGLNPRFLQSGRQSTDFYVDMWQCLLAEGQWTGELWNRRKSGEVYAEIKTISAVRDEQGNTTHYVALGSDITPMKEHQEELERIANYDLLTNLPNRVLLADRLSQAMFQCRRHEKSLAVAFLDLDGFKQVNDVHGHDIGDELLIALSLRMNRALREGDTLARIGGDEFVAVLADLSRVEDCEPVLKRLLLAASTPMTINENVINLSASIGVTFYPQDNMDADLLMRHADQAMYVAKETGKNRYHLFDTAQDDAIKVQRESLEAIRSALDNHQFVLYYQPKVNMRTGTVTGVEALIRWQHPERGLLNPIEFLPVIENNFMSIELGEWVIDTVLTQISQWQTMGLKLQVSTSVNISALQLQQSDFTEKLKTLLAAHPNVEPSYLVLEILETSALDDVIHASKIMDACMAIGVNFALDDFGTGYSSLTYLRRLPAKVIKIDQTFVRDMLHDPDDLAIVEGVIGLAKSFKREVIAEGVETIQHGTALLNLGCELAQGYGIAKPMPASDIPAWVHEWQPDVSWKI